MSTVCRYFKATPSALRWYPGLREGSLFLPLRFAFSLHFIGQWVLLCSLWRLVAIRQWIVKKWQEIMDLTSYSGIISCWASYYLTKMTVQVWVMFLPSIAVLLNFSVLYGNAQLLINVKNKVHNAFSRKIELFLFVNKFVYFAWIVNSFCSMSKNSLCFVVNRCFHD